MNARGFVLAGVVALCALVGALVLGVAPALAAAPEAPAPVTVEAVKAGSATFIGELNPGKEGEPGTYELGSYEFLYRKSPTECQGGSSAPEPAGMSLGGGEEGLPGQEVSGLEPGTVYTVCLRVETAGGATVGPAVTFTTAIPPETPEGLEAKPIGATAATLNGVLNPGKVGDPGSYEFLYRQSSSECQGENQVTTPQANATGAKEEPATANVEGLLPGTQYSFCLRAQNDAGEEATSAPVTFTTPVAAPQVEEAFVSDVASTSATFNAKVNPGGTATTYAFEYAPAGGAFAPVSEADGNGSVPAGAVGVPVSVHVDGLQPGAAYEFRVVVGNSVEDAVVGEVISLTTQRSGEFALPDGREWEMVTPPQKEGSLFMGTLEGEIERPDSDVVVQASAGGDGIVDEADQPVEAEPQGDANGVSVLSTRGPSGWFSQDLPSPHDEATNPRVGETGSEYRFFSEDLSRGVLQQFGNFTPLAPEAVESTPYLHTSYLNNDVGERCESPDLSPSSCFQPLVTRGDTQTGVAFGDVVNGECTFFECGPHFVAGTPDLSHVILASRERLTSTPITVPYIPGGSFDDPALYEWYGGQLRLLNILPGKEEGEPELQLGGGNKRHVMSDDGERVILEGAGGLYLRDVAKSETIQLDAAESGCGACSSGGGEYMTANGKGSRIFFLDKNKLTSDSDGGSADLYECEVVEVDGKLRCNLSNLAPETGGESANVRVVLGTSEDGSYVYFVAGGALASGATRQECNSKQSNKPCNLYVRHDGVTTFIAELTAEDANFYGFGGAGVHSAFYAELRARVSPDGRWLAFMSDRDLTGYDTRDADSGEPDEEVYLYEREHEHAGVCVV